MKNWLHWRHIVTAISALTPLVLIVNPAAAEMEYQMVVVNTSPSKSLSFKPMELGCSDVQNDRKVVNVRPKKEHTFRVYRSKKCSGKQGQMRVEISDNAGETRRFDFDYSNGGSIKWYGPKAVPRTIAQVYVLGKLQRNCIKNPIAGGFSTKQICSNVVKSGRKPCAYQTTCKGNIFSIEFRAR